MSQAPVQGERDRAMSYLHSTRKQFLDLADGLSEAQWNFKPGGEAWSLAELAEHLAVTERTVFLGLQASLARPPATPEEKAVTAGRDERVLRAVPDRSRKVRAPESVRPAGRFPSAAAAVAGFKTRRDETIRFIETTPSSLRDHLMPHPVLGPLDAYQWVLFLAAHCDRHIQQMKEVTADPNFPAQ